MKNPNIKKVEISNIPFRKLMITVTFLLIIGITVFYYAMKNKIMNDSQTQTISMIQSLAKQKDMMLTNTIINWYLYADTIAALSLDDKGEFVTVNIKKLNKLVSPSVVVFDPLGNTISNLDSTHSVNQAKYFNRVMAGEHVVTEMMEEESGISNDQIVAVAVPIKSSDGTVKGGVVCSYKISEIKDILSSEEMTEFGDTIIMDQNERIVVGSRKFDANSKFFDPEKEGEFFLDEEKKSEIREGIAQKRSDFVEFGEGKQNGLMLYEFNMTSEWTVITTVDQVGLQIHSYNITKNLLLTLRGAVVFAGIMYVIIFLLYIVIIQISNERSKALKAEKEELTNIVMLDSMTGLYNKKTAIDMIEKVLNEEQEDKKHGLFFVDIDNFKTVNDKFGHDEGDQLILLFAKIMKEHFRADDIVARFGGDEFIILVKNYGSEQTLIQLAERLCNLIYEKSKEKEAYEFSLSIGIAVYPEHGITSEELIKNADKALFWSKKEGKNRYNIYSNE